MREECDLPDDLIHPREAARLLGLHVGTLYRWAQTGRLRAWRVGPVRYLLSRRDVLAMVRPVEPRREVESAADRRRAHEAAVARLRAAGWET